MSLSSAMSTAQSIFSNTGLQSSALATNIANASNPDYARRVGTLTLDSNGGQVLKVDRTYDNGLGKQTVAATANDSAQTTLDNKLSDIRSLLGGNDYETSPSTYIATLRDNIQAYATKPNESTLASTVVASAQDVANNLNSISQTIQGYRGTIDGEISDQITSLNNLLTQFKDANDAIKAGTATGTDVNNELDARDGYLKQISSIVGVRSFTREDNDMVLYTADGTMLFDGSPRNIIFTPTSSYGASTDGNPVIVDGQALTAGQDGNTTAQGSLSALLQVRDDVIPTYQSQLDEIARGLIETTAQINPDDDTEEGMPGLFTWTGYSAGDSLSTTGETVPGMAALIKVNDNLVKSEGGDPTLLRDGGYDVDNLGADNSDYLGNIDGDASYSTLLDGLVSSFETGRDFDEDTYLDPDTSIVNYSAASVGWLEQYVSQSATAQDNKSAQLTRVTDALSNTTGVSLDEEMSLMLDLEQSYKASSKLVTAVDTMLDSLLTAIG
jgi:flagellar hook-associated protein 1 FlgK